MFDVKTGMLIWALEAITFATVLFALWFSAMRHLRALPWWSAGFALHGAGLAAIALRGHIPDFLSINVGNTFALLGIGLLTAGLQVLDRRVISAVILMPALLWSMGMLVPDISGQFWARCVLYQGCAAFSFATAAFTALSRPGPLSMARKLLAGLQIVQMGFALVAMPLITQNRPQGFQDMPQTPALAIISIFYIILCLVLAMRLVMEEHETTLKKLAATDPLTGALNRRGFAAAFARMGSVSVPGHPMTAIVHFDLDHFKKVNDLHGHAAGDAVLVAFSRILGHSSEKNGVCGRLGGEEFACAIRVASAADAVAFAGRARAALRDTAIMHAETPIHVSASAGISLSPAGTSTLDTMLSGSDRALYAAKHAGRDRIGLDCETGAQIVAPEDEAALSDTTDRQVAALNRVWLIGLT